jgi:hypothetical protein
MHMKNLKLFIITIIFAILLVSSVSACSQDSENGENGEAESVESTGNADNTGNTDNNGNTSQWQQEGFIIGAYDGLRMTGDHEKDMAALKLFSDAGFNMMVGEDYWYCSRYFEQSYVTRNPNAVSNKYILELLADFNKEYGKDKVRLIIFDNEFSFGQVPVNQPYYNIASGITWSCRRS